MAGATIPVPEDPFLIRNATTVGVKGDQGRSRQATKEAGPLKSLT